MRNKQKENLNLKNSKNLRKKREKNITGTILQNNKTNNTESTRMLVGCIKHNTNYEDSSKRNFLSSDDLLNTSTDDTLITKLYLKKDLKIHELNLLQEMSSTYINHRLNQLLSTGERKKLSKFNASAAIEHRRMILKKNNNGIFSKAINIFTDVANTCGIDNNKLLIHKSDFLSQNNNLDFSLGSLKPIHDIINLNNNTIINNRNHDAYSISNAREETTILSKNNNHFSLDNNFINLGFGGFNFMDPQEGFEFSWPELELSQGQTINQLKTEESQNDGIHPKFYRSCLEKKLSLEMALSKFNHISCSLENELCMKLNNNSRTNLLKIKNVEERLLNKLIEIKSSSPYHNYGEISKTSELISNLKREIEIQIRLIQTSKFKIELLKHSL